MNRKCVYSILVSLSPLLSVSADTTRILAINAGSGTRYGDFAPDLNTGGWFGIPAATNLAEAVNPAPAGVYESLKYNASAFGYTLASLKPGGRYTLRLHYNDNWFDHTFSLAVNGTQVETAFNPVVAAGNRLKRLSGVSFTDVTGTFGTLYRYTVRAYNAFGEGPAATVWEVRFPARKGTLIRVL